VEIVVIDPNPVTYFFANFGLYSAFRLSVDAAADDYWHAADRGSTRS